MRTEIEDRLVDFSSRIISMYKHFDNSAVSIDLADQLIRSATGAVMNYGEAIGAESRNFTHKIGIVLKELRETHINLKIIHQSKIYHGSQERIFHNLDECCQLISIFHKTALTLKQKR